MVTIGIANTLDLPDKLNARINSRLGQNRLVFVPYRSDQMQTIIESRLSDTKVIKPNAVSYISKKIASVSSDLRKTFNICRSVIRNKMNSLALKKTQATKNKRRGNSGQKNQSKNIELITLEDVVKEFRSVFCNNVTDLIEKSTSLQKAFWVSVFNLVTIKQTKQIYLSKLETRVNGLLLMLNLPTLRSQEFQLMVDQFIGQGLICRRGVALDFQMRKTVDRNCWAEGFVKVDGGRVLSGDIVLIVEVDLDDIAYALRNDDIWLSHKLEDDKLDSARKAAMEEEGGGDGLIMAGDVKGGLRD